MDPRLEFTFQLLIDATGLPRHDIMDHVFEGDMVRHILHFLVLILVCILIDYAEIYILSREHY